LDTLDVPWAFLARLVAHEVRTRMAEAPYLGQRGAMTSGEPIVWLPLELRGLDHVKAHGSHLL
jgi:hypothetical protein